MAKHLVFYDGQCGFCDCAVQFIIRNDKNKQFIFAPLQGTTAKTLLEHLPRSIKNEDTLILIENYDQSTSQSKMYILGKGALRICWLLGGGLAIPGIFSWLPAWSIDWAYKLVARNRHRFFKNTSCVIPRPDSKDRFLP